MQISQSFPFCESEETVEHAIVKCSWATVVWFSGMGIRWGYASVSELGRMTHQCAQNGRNGRITRKEEPTEGGGVCMGNMERALSSDARWRWPETRSCYTGNHKTGRGDVDFMADVRGCNGKNIWTNNTTYCNATKMEETRGKYHKIEL